MSRYYVILLVSLVIAGLAQPACTSPYPLPEANRPPVPSVPPQPPQIALSDFAISPAVAGIGEPVKVIATVQNRGGQGVYKAVLKVNGQDVDSQVLPVAVAGTSAISFVLRLDKMGRYQVGIDDLKANLVISDCTRKSPATIQYDAGAAYAGYLFGTGNMGHLTVFTPPAIPFTIQKVLLYATVAVDNDGELDRHIATIIIRDSKNIKIWSQDYPWRAFRGFSTWKEFEVSGINVTDEFSVEFISHSEPARPRDPWGLSLEPRYTCVSLGATRPVITSPSEIPRLRSWWSGEGMPLRGGLYDALDWLIRVEGQGCLLEYPANQ